MQISMSIIRDIIFGAVRYGADLGELCKNVNLSVNELNQTELSLDLEQGHQVWEQALKLTQDQHLGLHIGEQTNPSIVGLVGHLMQTSPNLHTAFEHLQKFSKIVTDVFFYEIQRLDKECKIIYTPISFWQINYPKTAIQAVEQAMSGSLHVCKLLTGKSLCPIRINFTQKCPKNTNEYQRVLKGNLFFEQKENSLIFKVSDFNLPVIGYNQFLMQTFEQLLQELLQKIQNQERTENKVKKTILQHFKQQIPQLDQISAHLHMTNRSLQRKLKEEGTNFQEISEEIRKVLAIDLIRYKQFNINEIAYMLGYTEASTFRRAFKRWTGKAPKSYVF